MIRILISLFVLFVALGCNEKPQSETTSTDQASEAKNQVEQVLENHPNGVLKIKGTTIDGIRNGHWESYYDNGYKWSEVEYQMGVKHGPVVVFYQNGMMRYQGRYNDDDRVGIWTFYDTLGVTVRRIDMDEVNMNPDSLLNS